MTAQESAMPDMWFIITVFFEGNCISSCCSYEWIRLTSEASSTNRIRNTLVRFEEFSNLLLYILAHVKVTSRFTPRGTESSARHGPGKGRGGLKAVPQQRELRGLSARVRAVAELLRVFSLRVLALVSPSLQVSFSRKVFSSGAAVHGPGGISPLSIGSALVPLPGGRPVAVNWSRGAPCVKLLLVHRIAASTEPGGGLGFAAAPVPLAFVSFRFRLSSRLVRWNVECVVSGEVVGGGAVGMAAGL